MIDWQPIETAQTHPDAPGARMPRVLLWYPSLGVRIGQYCRDEFAMRPRPYWMRDGAEGALNARHPQPTHWAPLPEGPK